MNPESVNLAGLQKLPGRINAHDHLEFNLFPRLGRGPYPNATAWAVDVYRPHESPVAEHRSVPRRTRLFWGGLKNLLSGVTTVCHHNPHDPLFEEERFPVRVVKEFGWAHSLHFSSDVAERCRATPPEWPFLIHLGEGTDATAAEEIHRLDALGALDSRTVLIHGVALGPGGLDLVLRRGASLIWCPASNLFMLHRTLEWRLVPAAIPVALGTDSALTAPGDLLDEIAVAAQSAGVEAADLLPLIGEGAARVLRLPQRPNDWIAARTPLSPPDLVVIGGAVRLISEELAGSCPPGFHRVHLEGRPPVFVDVDVPAMRVETEAVLGRGVCLSGRRLL